jgi:eukaryotic-like serine/threonine-protein kinase
MLKPGSSFERYTIDALIGQGGMGCVYRAHDPRLERSVALKVISDGGVSPESTGRLLREARSAAALDHPNAVAIFDVGETDGTPYIVMELVDGQTLRGAVGQATITREIKLGWLTDVARALAAAHRKGLVHRDVKPENVMVRADGVVKVLDFGIARRTQGEVDPTAATSQALPTLTAEGARLGTPLYMAPEQIRGDALDGRADQFAWSVLAYELLAGKLPWRGGSDALAVAASILTDEPSESPLDQAGVPARVKAVLLRALSKRPADRFASMDEVVRALEAAARGEDAPSVKSAPPAHVSAAQSIPRATSPAPASETTARRYSEEEVRAILARAIDQQSATPRDDGKLAYDDLLAAAQEVGVDTATLRDASRAVRLRDQESAELANERAERDAWIRRKRRGFARHLGVYLIVNAMFLLLGMLTGGLPGTLVPGLFWGMGLGIHGLRAFMANEDDWIEARDRKRKEEAKRRRREERAAVVGRVVDKGVSLLLGNDGKERRDGPRVDASAAAAEAARKVRFATGGSRRGRDDAEAEAEDLADEIESKRRGRR